MSLRIGIDIDGVVADFRSAFHAAAKRCLRRDIHEPDDPKAPSSLDQKDVRKVWALVAKTPNWWLELQPYEPGQLARLYDLTRARGWEVFFLTNRPASAGDTVQFQTQWWLERNGFYLPSVLTVPGSRGDIANGLRLDIVLDDLVMNCVDIVSASPAKALLVHRIEDAASRKHALDRGIGVTANVHDALAIIERLHELLPGRRGRLLRLTDWFMPSSTTETLPHSPRADRPLPPIRT